MVHIMCAFIGYMEFTGAQHVCVTRESGVWKEARDVLLDLLPHSVIFFLLWFDECTNLSDIYLSNIPCLLPYMASHMDSKPSPW